MDGNINPTVSRTTGGIVRYWADVQPEAPAFVAEGKQPLAYAALAACQDRIRDTLEQAGLGFGRRVAILHPGGPELATLLLGVMDGAVAVPMNVAAVPDEILARVNGCRVDGVIVDASASKLVRDALLQTGLPIFEPMAEEPEVTGKVALNRIAAGVVSSGPHEQPDDLALVLASSGTTADSKIVPIRHRHIVARSRATVGLLELTPDDRGLIFNKLFLHGGIANTMACLLAGSSVIAMPQFNAVRFFHYLTSLDPTWYVGSFTINRAIYEAGLQRSEPPTSTRLRMIRWTSAAVDAVIGDRLEAWFGVPVIEAYATTETGRITGNPQPPGLRKSGTVGLPVDCEVAVMDHTGKRLATGVVGEVVVRGDNVFDGYENNPAANAMAFFDDWYRTGDLGRFDDDGYLTLIGRIKEMINRGGEKISPQEVDDALAAHADVADAAAFAIPHPSLGEVVAAAVVPTPGAHFDKSELTRFLWDRLSSTKIPCAFLMVSEIPRGPHGKVLRNKLAEQFAAQ